MRNILDISRDSSRRVQLRNDKAYIHIMKYMGSKRELLPEIKTAVEALCKPGDTILDIFAGTQSVGAYLKNSFDIIGNDIQAYSKVLGEALIVSSQFEMLRPVTGILERFEIAFRMNRDQVHGMLRRTLDASDDFLLVGKGNWKEIDRKKYLAFAGSFPSPENGFSSGNEELMTLYRTYIAKNSESITSTPFIQTAFLFSETYFSLRQAIDIDSIRFAIESEIHDQTLKSIWLAALIHAYSYCSSGTGHFAMFRDIKTVKSAEDVFLYRTRSVWSIFIKKLHELYEFHSFVPNRNYTSTCQDYVDLLKRDDISFDLVYADPPYSFVHYSRFYHAVESLVKYDYNIPVFKGRYRDDRYQSPFCQRQNVAGAFGLLFHLCSRRGAKILLSYSDTGMISLEEIRTIAEQNGYFTSVKEIVYNHSTLGREGHKSNRISEYLVSATPN